MIAETDSIYTCYAPAKINLRLKVVGRRDDGYHLLQMLNTTISLVDTIEVTLKKDEGVHVAVEGEFSAALYPELIDPKRNLVSRAFTAFCEEYSLTWGADIKIKKKIPLGGGLGGGSSDAAAMLRLLAGLFPEAGRSSLPLVSLAAKLGADVPFFLYGGLCEVAGIGEIVEPFSSSPLSGWPCYLLFPPYGIETAQVFAILRKQPIQQTTCVPKTIGTTGLLKRVFQQTPITPQEIFDTIENDLEPWVAACKPELIGTLNLLRQECPGFVVGLSGSGSTLFALPRNREASPQALGMLAREQGLSMQGVTCTNATLS